MQRLIALIILLIPGLIAAWGIKLMRDGFFSIIHPPFSIVSVQFLTGLILFLLGLAFIGGFVLYRDQKRNKVQPRFEKKNKKENISN